MPARFWPSGPWRRLADECRSRPPPGGVAGTSRTKKNGPLPPRQIRVDRRELLQGRLEVLDDLGGDDVRVRQVLRGVKALVPQPEDVQAVLVALDQLLIGVGPPAPLRIRLRPGGLTLVPVLRPVAGHEFVQIRALQG